MVLIWILHLIFDLRNFDGDPFTKAQFLRRFDATSLVRRILICSILDSAIACNFDDPTPAPGDLQECHLSFFRVDRGRMIKKLVGTRMKKQLDKDDDDYYEEEEEGEEEEVDVTMLLLMRFWFSWHDSEPMR